MKIQYRSDIQALRAVAVLAVIVYHANIYFLNNKVLSGGFLGVDIFFVISGYLISKIILNEINISGKLIILVFLKNRLRRIVPALFFVLLATIVFAHIYLFPLSLLEFGKSLIASIFFLSNYYYLLEGHQYGVNDLIFRPLLHTWSLGIEVQFYIFFSFLFFFFYKKIIYFNRFIIFIFSISLLTAIYGNLNFSENNFYLINARIWEFIIGYVICIFEKLNYVKNQNKKINIFFVTGVFLTIYSLFFFSIENEHPSIKTIIPILGIFLIITFNKTNLDKVEKNFIYVSLVFLGNCSYSLYLWHYPLFIFSNSINFTDGQIFNKLLVFFLLATLSFLSYYYVEKPFRKPKNYFYNRFIIVCTAAFITIGLSGLYTYKKFYFYNDLDLNSSISLENNAFYSWNNKKYLDLRNQYIEKFKNENFLNNYKKKVLILGNSYGEDLFISLKQNENLYKKIQFGLASSQLYCFTKKHYNLNKCKQNYIHKINMLLKSSDIIIVSARWSAQDKKLINEIFIFLKSLNKKIIITSYSEEFYFEKYFTILDFFTYKNKRFPQNEEVNGLKKEYFKKRYKTSLKNNLLIEKYAKKYNFDYLKKIDYQCATKKKECDYITDNHEKIYYDKGHISLEGAKYFGKKIFDNKMLNLD